MNENVKTAPEQESEYLVEVNNLVKWFPIKSSFFRRTIGHVRAVDGVTFKIKRGQTMGLVGESGCGKTTVGRTILRLIDRTSGEVKIGGRDIFALSREELRLMRPEIQIIFQDPYSSLSPRIPVGEIIGEAVREHNIVPPEEFDDYISRVMRACGLQEYHKDRYPHEFSGGQRQRICIARALALNPEFIVCDEPVSALDVSIQAQIINLLKQLQKNFGFTYLFISHDLSVVEHISDTVGVMYLGNLVEYAPTDSVFKHPLHPYTVALFFGYTRTRPGREGEQDSAPGQSAVARKPADGLQISHTLRQMHGYLQMRCARVARDRTRALVRLPPLQRQRRTGTRRESPAPGP